MDNLLLFDITESSHSDSEKTFAIIIGLLAGVALIIILATFMRRTFGENGKFCELDLPW